MKIHFSSSRGKTKSNFSSRISRDRDSCQGLIQSLPAYPIFPAVGCVSTNNKKITILQQTPITLSSSSSSSGTSSSCVKNQSLSTAPTRIKNDQCCNNNEHLHHQRLSHHPGSLRSFAAMAIRNEELKS